MTGAHAVIDVANWEPGIPLDREDINLGAAVQRAVASARGIASERGVRCAVDPATLDADLRVRANAPLLDHILDEFLRNALKAARPGDTVTIRSLPVGDQVWLRLEHGDPSRRSAATVAFQRGRGRENDSADHLPVAGTGSSD